MLRHFIFLFQSFLQEAYGLCETESPIYLPTIEARLIQGFLSIIYRGQARSFVFQASIRVHSTTDLTVLASENT